MSSDLQTKRIIIGTICLIALACSFTLCLLALREAAATNDVKELGLFVVGIIGGMLAKTGVDKALEPVAVVNAPGDELKVKEDAG